MNKLNGKVLELFNDDKKKYKISKICYGQKALDKFANVTDNNLNKKWINSWDINKIDNSVYFVYNNKKGKIHRFISSASKLGNISYLGHIEKSKRKSKKLSKKRSRRRSKKR